jgi:hypothetical protein
MRINSTTVMFFLAIMDFMIFFLLLNIVRRCCWYSLYRRITSLMQQCNKMMRNFHLISMLISFLLASQDECRWVMMNIITTNIFQHLFLIIWQIAAGIYVKIQLSLRLSFIDILPTMTTTFTKMKMDIMRQYILYYCIRKHKNRYEI